MMSLMNFIVPVLVLLVSFLILSQTFWVRRFIELRINKGALFRHRDDSSSFAKSNNQRATLFDVKRLIASGEHILAVRLYRKIYKGASRKEAQRAVEEMERSIIDPCNNKRTDV